MYISAKTLDDLLMRVITRLLRSKSRTSPGRGDATELIGVLLKLSNPRARLSRTESRSLLFSSLGELLWYLAGSNELAFIAYYIKRYRKESSDGRTIHGAYGPRLFNLHGVDQVRNVINLLKRRRDSRRAVIQLFDASDLERDYKEIPCTCTLQFMVRRGRLHMFTSMRSNDAFLGLPHDVFVFTMLQEIFARTLDVEVGEYMHAVGSLHLYEEHRKRAQRLVGEGWQTTKLAMPAMPIGDPWVSIRTVLNAESAIRHREVMNLGELSLHEYWEDLVRLLEIYGSYMTKNIKGIARLKSEMSSDIYDMYIESKKYKAAQKRPTSLDSQQRKLFRGN